MSVPAIPLSAKTAVLATRPAIANANVNKKFGYASNSNKYFSYHADIIPAYFNMRFLFPLL